jgi:hypothetical protein
MLTLAAFLKALMIEARLPLVLGCGVGVPNARVFGIAALVGWLVLEALAAWLRDERGAPWFVGSLVRIVRATLIGAIVLGYSGRWLAYRLEQAGWLACGEWVLPR